MLDDGSENQVSSTNGDIKVRDLCYLTGDCRGAEHNHQPCKLKV